jgi:MinD-like ATPase involved in chromosome partitioning or flagellar assembly
MITINMDKAKAIGHQLRRAQREAEFAPLDSQIAKQIPGVDTAATEAARQNIRDKYATIEAEIDAAADPHQIKAALGL